MHQRPPEKLLRRQLAARRLFLREGVMTNDARLFVFLMKKACGARRGDRQVILDNSGSVDPIATACQAARRELFDEFVHLLNLDNYTVTNITQEED